MIELSTAHRDKCPGLKSKYFLNAFVTSNSAMILASNIDYMELIIYQIHGIVLEAL